MGYPLALAGAYTLLGIGPGAIETLNIASAAVSIWLVYDIGRISWNRTTGAVAAATLAVVPSHVLLALPPLTESLYTVVVTAVVRLAVGRSPRPVVAAAAVGIMLAGAQYVRATASSLLLPIVIVPLVAGAGLRHAAARATATVLAFGIALLPVVSYNLQAHGDLSVSTSAYAGWSLFVGANRESAGQFNAADSALFAELPGGSAWERSERAGALGLRRIANDPVGYLRLQPRKFGVLWGSESYAGAYAFSPAGPVAPRQTVVAGLLTQLAYVPIVVLALLGLIRERRRPSDVALLIGLIVFVVAASHIFLEVHSRYHAYLLPLLVLLAARGAMSIGTWVRARARTRG